MIPDLLEKWLGDKLPSVIDRSHMQRETRPALPFEMVREAVINALIHRDYDIKGAKCQLTVTGDAVTIKSPGAPPPPITLEQLQSFNAPMLSRNPVLHYIFSHMGLAEERGLGVKTLKADAQKEGLPLPRYAWAAPYLSLTLYRSTAGAERALDAGILASLSKAERSGWQWLSTRDFVTSSEYAAAMSVPYRTAMNHLKRFTNLRLLYRDGAGPLTKYKVLSP